MSVLPRNLPPNPLRVLSSTVKIGSANEKRLRAACLAPVEAALAVPAVAPLPTGSTKPLPSNSPSAPPIRRLRRNRRHDAVDENRL